MTTESGRSNLRQMAIGAIGVVYGDIGTSPLYTLHECFSEHIGLPARSDVIFGFLSLIFWVQMLVVSLKYICFVMRADNQGEGGILALMSLSGRNTPYYTTTLLLILGLIGCGLFYGDSIITPAMSVLSALEGMNVIAPAMGNYIVPIALCVLLTLFIIQQQGTAFIGKYFGPLMVVWFLVLALLGVIQIIHTPTILRALHPGWAWQFMLHYHSAAFLALGAVVLAITGGEALYADMGHFGRRPIQVAWFALVAPALTLNYFGQGALILTNPAALANPFFYLAPSWAMAPLVLLATLATIIASQAVISGAFSMTRQAVRLGYLPQMTIRHTSADEAGQIYIPFINWMLFIFISLVILLFRESSALASAYGIAVTGTMAITTVLACYVAYYNWHWPLWLVKIIGALLLAIDIPFFSSNLTKVFDGGWLPLGIGILSFTIMANWKWENFQLLRQISRLSLSVSQFNSLLKHEKPLVIAGTAIYLTRSDQGVPHALVHNVRHNHVLHARILCLQICTHDLPYIPAEKQLEVRSLMPGIDRLLVHYGFNQTPELDALSQLPAFQALAVDLQRATFFFSRETLNLGPQRLFSRLRAQLFIWLRKNALSPCDVIQIPPGRVIEMGMQLTIQ